ncbi:hypothetical protein KUTeg_019558 [Tegillarca granosa]|uniref:PH domain-containing protein n=1 Tax=Tegillarca granosa TaxID=220873 RepID=A0ABQ9EHX2_TEGGR|nr:hypothetical protein KUTeg_019558 [Tegillarca granosa]
MIWKKRWIALLNASSKGPTRLVKYPDDKKAADDEQLSDIKLKEVVNVVRLAMEERPGITLQMVDHSTKQFYCLSENDANDWLQKLQNEANKVEHLPPGMFHVFLLPSATLDFFGECMVEINDENVCLYEDKSKSVLITTWPITSIRRYGADARKERILIEVGRMCPTGEGVYLLRSVYHAEIQKLIDNQAKKIRKRNSNSSLSDDFSNVNYSGHPS